MQIGQKLGAYEVIAKLGEGGMGEVYRARDGRLDRDVALKVLPELFADDPERLARFTREAKTLAALNHPHIAQIFGVEQQGAASALVMELVEGEDLAQRIARGPLPSTMPFRSRDRSPRRSRPPTKRDRPSRSETREHQGPRRWHSEGPRLRSREGH